MTNKEAFGLMDRSLEIQDELHTITEKLGGNPSTARFIMEQSKQIYETFKKQIINDGLLDEEYEP